MKIIWSPLAVDKVIEIAQYIAIDKPTVGKQWTINIFETVKKLKEHPKLGKTLSELEIEDCLELIYGNYRIIYTIP